MMFIKGRKKKTHVDERDQEIDRNSRLIGVTATWMFLISTVLWNSHHKNHSISLSFLNWLVWTQFAIFFLVHGLVSIISYRKQRHAS